MQDRLRKIEHRLEDLRCWRDQEMAKIKDQYEMASADLVREKRNLKRKLRKNSWQAFLSDQMQELIENWEKEVDDTKLDVTIKASEHDIEIPNVGRISAKLFACWSGAAPQAVRNDTGIIVDFLPQVKTQVFLLANQIEGKKAHVSKLLWSYAEEGRPGEGLFPSQALEHLQNWRTETLSGSYPASPTMTDLYFD